MSNSRYSKRIVAFVDILGFKAKTENAVESDDAADDILYALNRIHKIKQDNEKDNIGRNVLDIQVTTFSDSAVISYPDKKDNLFWLIIDIIHLQLDLILYGVLIRGGICIGDLYHDGDIVFGPAMNKAYFLESKVAIYPRIIVEDTAVEHYVKHVDGDKYDIDDIKSLILEDNDGLIYVDMLHQDQEMYDMGDEYYNWLLDIRSIIEGGLSNEKIDIRMKYEWLKKYYNNVVTDDRAFFPSPYSLNDEQRRLFRSQYKELKI